MPTRMVKKATLPWPSNKGTKGFARQTQKKGLLKGRSPDQDKRETQKKPDKFGGTETRQLQGLMPAGHPKSLHDY